jgi:hypothetical protein
MLSRLTALARRELTRLCRRASAPRARKPQRCRPQLEPLEDRRTPTVNIFLDSAGVLHVIGDFDSHTIDLNVDLSATAAQVVVTVDDVASRYAENQVRRVLIDAGGGDDFITISNTRRSVNVEGGTGQDLIRVEKVSPSPDADTPLEVSIHAGSGNDAIAVCDETKDLSNIQGLINVDGGASPVPHDLLTIFDSNADGPEPADPVPHPFLYTVTGGSLTRSRFGPPVTITYSQVGSVEVDASDRLNVITLTNGPPPNTDLPSPVVTVKTGDGGDTTRVLTDLAFRAFVQGGSGFNVLDYSSYSPLGDDYYPTIVYMNLHAHEATGLAQVTGFHNGIGSTYNNIMVGDEEDGTLLGGPGHDIIIGGRQGHKDLIGGGGEVILIDGSTDYDNSAETLMAIERIWARPVPFGERVSLLQGTLTVDRIHSNDTCNTLLAHQLGGGRGWFFVKCCDSFDAGLGDIVVYLSCVDQ